MQANSIKRGALIVLEGCDRVGKTTQSKLLAKALSELNFPAQHFPFPDRSTRIGGVINDYLANKEDVNDKAIHLLFSGNRWELESRMRKLLNCGTTLVVDRYAFSGVAYSAAKDGMSLDWCRQADVGLPKPDIVFLLHMGRDSLNERPGFGEERYENHSFLSKVWENYQALKDRSFKEIDADKTIDDLHGILLKEAVKTIKCVAEQPIEKLWV